MTCRASPWIDRWRPPSTMPSPCSTARRISACTSCRRADNVLGHLQLVQEGLGFALLPDSVGSLLPPGVVLKPLAWDPTPMVSIAVAWKSGNTSPLVRGFVDLVRQSSGSHAARRRNRPSGGEPA